MENNIQKISVPDWDIEIIKPKLKNNSIIMGNCVDILKTFPNKSVDLILTDPPVCGTCDLRDCNRSTAQHFTSIDDFVFKVEDRIDIVIAALWDKCFSDKNFLTYVITKQIGWQGGTIYQVADYIMQQKEKWN